MAEVAPRDDVAAASIELYKEFAGPLAGYREQVYFMTLAGDSDDRAIVMLQNAAGDLGLSLEFSVMQLRCFSLWKNTQAEEDGYVVGLEPSTSFPNLKSFERERGRLITLKSRETYEAKLTMAVHTSAESVNRMAKRIMDTQGEATMGMYRLPHKRFSPQ